MKYKLIKEYPGSPSLGTIAKYSKSHGAIEFTSPKGKLHYSGSDAINFFKNLVSNHPEFWEQVAEKDYEILSIKNIYGNILDSHQAIIDFEKGKNINYKIYSVKRLSDGEVFTIGDKVIWGTVQITIKEFHITYANVLWCVGSTGTKLNLKSVQYVKQPLFTTEDGVDVYYNDKISTILLKTMELYTIDGLAGNNTTPEKGFKYFSTKEKAEEYIINNKPCLSIQEVLNNIEYNPHWSISEFLKVIKMNLETTVKQKLNK